jgi:hypothetical protein
MAYKIKISIKSIEPEIWRRIKIPGGITFQHKADPVNPEKYR